MATQLSSLRVLLYDGSIPVKGKDINYVTETVPLCRFAADAIAVASWKEIETKLSQRVGQGDKLEVLTCCGHAAPGSMTLAGIIDATSGHQRKKTDSDLEYDEGTKDVPGPFLETLGKFFQVGGLFFLAGCGIAEEERGENLLRKISEHLPKIWVVGAMTDVTEVCTASAVEIHQAQNQKDKGLVEPLGLRVAFGGKIVHDEDDFPNELIGKIAVWPLKQ